MIATARRGLETFGHNDAEAVTLQTSVGIVTITEGPDGLTLETRPYEDVNVGLVLTGARAEDGYPAPRGLALTLRRVPYPAPPAELKKR